MSDLELSAPGAEAPAVPLPPEPLPAASFDDPEAARKAIKLALPIRYAGRRIDTVYLRRLTVGQVRTVLANFSRARLADPDALLDWKLFVDEDGTPVPDEALDLIDADDFETLDEAALDFLPRRFRAQPENQPAASAPVTGENTAPS